MVEKNRLLLFSELSGAVIVIGLLLYFFRTDEPDIFIIAGLGLVPSLVPLLALNKFMMIAPQCGIKEKGEGLICHQITLPYLHFLLILFFSVITIILTFLCGDLLVGGLLVFLDILLWYLVLYHVKWERVRMQKLTNFLMYSEIGFLFFYLPAFLFYIPIRSLMIQIMPIEDVVLNILEGIAVMMFLVFAWKVVKYRIAFLNAVLLAVLWYQLETGWIMRNWDRLMGPFLGTLIFAIAVMFFLLITAACVLGRYVGETIELARSQHSAFLGPWFTSLFHRSKLNTIQINEIKHGIRSGILLLLIGLPGILIVSDCIPVKIAIHPRTNYTMRFNFWANGNLSLYPTEVQQSLNAHHANLDLTLGDISLDTIQTLIAFENAMPNITYRLTVSPPRFNLLTETIIQRTEILMAYEKNLTLTQWRGFLFDIEGNSFNWKLSFNSSEEASIEWAEMFNYVYNNASIRRGKIIDLENVGSHIFGTDMVFDGDLDNQLIEGYVSNYPDNFTTYAPMIYRCLTDDRKCLIPSETFFSPWLTSYWIYDSLYTLNGTLKDENKLGIYLGVTNCSCYSRDLIQNEHTTWGNSTGYQNLLRDTLIAKAFGVREVTFFLQWSVLNAGCDCLTYGAFDSYGNDFLDVMNETVNSNPPSEFYIYRTNRDADLNLKLYRDVIGDVSHIKGSIFVITAWIISIGISLYSSHKEKKEEKNAL